MRAQRLLQTGARGAQATPTFEHVASAPGSRLQVRQPSVHSRQSALGGANGPVVLAGAAGRAGGTSAAAATAGHSATAVSNTTLYIRTVISAR
jgi:hypothetical protein